MKMSKKTATAIGSIWLIISNILMLLLVVFITMKCTGAVDWSWWVTLIPLFCVAGLPIVTIVLVIIYLLTKTIIADMRRSKRVEAEAKMYGMERRPGESTAELKKRIVRRNMISGNYSRKDIKDAILAAFPNCGSCQIYVGNQTDTVVLFPRKAAVEGSAIFSDEELMEIAEFAAQYIPANYKVTAINAEEKDGEEEHNKTYN